MYLQPWIVHIDSVFGCIITLISSLANLVMLRIIELMLKDRDRRWHVMRASSFPKPYSWLFWNFTVQYYLFQRSNTQFWYIVTSLVSAFFLQLFSRHTDICYWIMQSSNLVYSWLNQIRAWTVTCILTYFDCKIGY